MDEVFKIMLNVNIKKKTFISAYNQLKLMSDLEFPNYQKGEPLHNLVMEIKRDLKKQMRQQKVNVWKELLDFWPLSIGVPAMLLSLLWGSYALGS